MTDIETLEDILHREKMSEPLPEYDGQSQKESNDIYSEIMESIPFGDFKGNITEYGERKIVADGDVDHNEIAVQGSTVTSQGASPKAVVQYTLVFDDPAQQKDWYEFIRWLRSQPAYDGETTAEKLMSFVEAHSEL